MPRIFTPRATIVSIRVAAFYRSRPLRPVAQIRADLLAVEEEAEGLLQEVLGGGEQ